jgi:hypothetical protein
VLKSSGWRVEGGNQARGHHLLHILCFACRSTSASAADLPTPTATPFICLARRAHLLSLPRCERLLLGADRQRFSLLVCRLCLSWLEALFLVPFLFATLVSFLFVFLVAFCFLFFLFLVVLVLLFLFVLLVLLLLFSCFSFYLLFLFFLLFVLFIPFLCCFLLSPPASSPGSQRLLLQLG